MKEPVFFSVIIPSHNRPLLLQRAIESIKSQQGGLRCEIIVVADVANPDTERVCQTLLGNDDIYIIREGKHGPAESRNIGLERASGRYILFLDDDDAWHPDLLAQLADRAEIREGKFVYFECSSVVESRAAQQPRFISETARNYANMLNERVYVQNRIPIPCFAFPRERIGKIRFDPYLKAYEDWDFILALLDNGEFPTYLPIRGIRIFSVKDDSTDRRGDHKDAKDLPGAIIYLYVYYRHPAPTVSLQQQREIMIKLLGIPIPYHVL
jgi:glycosyltransferase involved in cell wall biosynthesis